MGISHKSTSMVSPSLAYAIGQMSKNALVDLVWDLAVKQLGDEHASDEAIADLITEWSGPVLTIRNDKRVDIRAVMERLRNRP